MEHGGERGDVGAQQAQHRVKPDAARRERARERVDLRLQRAVRRLGPRRRVDQRDAAGILGSEITEQVVVDARGGDLDVGERAGEHGQSPSTAAVPAALPGAHHLAIWVNPVPPSTEPGILCAVWRYALTDAAACAARRRSATCCSAASNGVMLRAAATSNRVRTVSPIAATRSMISARVPRPFASRSR